MTEENICHIKSSFPEKEEVNAIANELSQEAKADKDKLPLVYVPTGIIRAIGAVRKFGVEKYKAPDNWKRVEIERYKSAMFRHWLEYLDDPKAVDDESGLPALWHCACNLAFLIELEKE